MENKLFIQILRYIDIYIYIELSVELKIRPSISILQVLILIHKRLTKTFLFIVKHTSNIIRITVAITLLLVPVNLAQNNIYSQKYL